MELPSAVTEPTTTTTTTTISRRRDRNVRDLDTVRDEANRLGVALEAAREEVERLAAALEAERAAIRALRRERDRDVRAAREQEAARGRATLCDLRGRLERELEEAVRRAKEAVTRELGTELNRALRERDVDARRDAEAARTREEDLKAQLRVALREAAVTASQHQQFGNTEHLQAELSALRARCKELEDKLRNLAEADRRKAADLREQHEQHEAEMATLRKASQQETVRLLEELRSKDRAISQLGREANLQAGRAEESRGRLLEKQCQHCEERERRIMKRASDTREKRQLIRKLREDEQNNNNKNHRRNGEATQQQQEEVNSTTTKAAVEQKLRLQLEEKDRIIAALQAAEKEKSKKLDQLTKRHRKEQMRHYYRQFMELEPVVEQEEDSGADSPSPSISPQPSPELWGTAEGSEYAALLRDHVELQGEYAALQAKRLRLEHELASARMHARDLRRIAAEHTGAGSGQSCADRMKTLHAEADDLREQNELLEFRILELEEYGSRDSHTSLRSPDTRDVWTDTESDSGVQSLSVEEPPDLHEIDLEIKRQELKSRLLGLSATAGNVEDRSCLQQVLALLESYEQRLEAEGRVLGHPESAENPSKISTRRIVAKVLPFTDLQEARDVEDEGDQGIRRQQLKNAECLQESGIFEETPIEFLTQSTQTEDSPYFPAGLLKCVGSVGELGEELRRLNEIRELVEERARGDCEPLRITASHLKELAYCRERLQLLENKVLIYESTGDQQTRLLSERLQREIKLSQQVKELSTKLSRLDSENKRLEEERCELEEAENDTRLRCQKLEAKLVALGERKSELQLQLTQERREIDRLKSIMAESERGRTGQMSYLESMINKYEQRNYELEERAMELNTRIDLLETSLPAIIMFNMFQLMHNENVPCKDLTNALSASLLKAGRGRAEKMPPALLSKEWAAGTQEAQTFSFPETDTAIVRADTAMERLTVCSEMQCISKLQDLIQSETMLKRRILELERKETAYMETLQQADALWSDMEIGYKQQISKSEQNEAIMRDKVKRLEKHTAQGDDELMERLTALEQNEAVLLEQVRLLENEKMNMGKQLDEARVAFELCSSELEGLKGNVEGPLKTELAKERVTSQELLQSLKEKEKEVQKIEDRNKAEIHGLKVQLNKISRDLVDSECTCSELKEEVETLEMKVSELKISLEEQNQKEEMLMIQLSQAVLKKEQELEKIKQVLLAKTSLRDELKEVQMIRHPESSMGGKFSGASTAETAVSKVGAISDVQDKPETLHKDYLWTQFISNPCVLELEEDLEEAAAMAGFLKPAVESVPIVAPSHPEKPEKEAEPIVPIISPPTEAPPSIKPPQSLAEAALWSQFISDPCNIELEEDLVEAALLAGFKCPEEKKPGQPQETVLPSFPTEDQKPAPAEPPEGPLPLPTTPPDAALPFPTTPPEAALPFPTTPPVSESTKPMPAGVALLPLGECKIKCSPDCICEKPQKEKMLPSSTFPEDQAPVQPVVPEVPVSTPSVPPAVPSKKVERGCLKPLGECEVKCTPACVCPKPEKAISSKPDEIKSEEPPPAEVAPSSSAPTTKPESAPPVPPPLPATAPPGADIWSHFVSDPCSIELEADLEEAAMLAGFTRPKDEIEKAAPPPAETVAVPPSAEPAAPAEEAVPVPPSPVEGAAEYTPPSEPTLSSPLPTPKAPETDEEPLWKQFVSDSCNIEIEEDLEEAAKLAGFSRPGVEMPKIERAAPVEAVSVPRPPVESAPELTPPSEPTSPAPLLTPQAPEADKEPLWKQFVSDSCNIELEEDLEEAAKLAGFSRPGIEMPKPAEAVPAPKPTPQLGEKLLPKGQCTMKCYPKCTCDEDKKKGTALPFEERKSLEAKPVTIDKGSRGSIGSIFSLESEGERVSAEDFEFGEQGSMIGEPPKSLITFRQSELDRVFDELEEEEKLFSQELGAIEALPFQPPFEETMLLPGEQAPTFMLEESYEEPSSLQEAVVPETLEKIPEAADEKATLQIIEDEKLPEKGDTTSQASTCKVFCWDEEGNMIPLPPTLESMEPNLSACKVFCWEPIGERLPEEKPTPAEEITKEIDLETIEDIVPEVEEAPPAEEVPEVEEAPPAEEVPEVEETPPAEEVSEVEEAPPAEEVPEVEETPPAEEVPEVEEAPPAEVPEVEEAPPEEEVPEVEEAAPEVEEAPPAEEVPEVEETLPAEEVPEVEETPPAEEMPEVEEAPPAEEVPVEEAPPAEEVSEVEEAAPEVEEAPPEEEVPEVEEAPPEEVSEVEEAAPEVEEAPPAEEVPEVEEAPPEEVSEVEEAAPEVEEAPPAEEVPEVEEAPPEEVSEVEEAAPEVEEAPPAEEVPEVEEAPPAEVPEVEEAPPAEEVPEVEEAPPAEEVPEVEEAPPAEEVPEVEEAPPAEEVPEGEEAPPAEEVSEVEEVQLEAPGIREITVEITIEKATDEETTEERDIEADIPKEMLPVEEGTEETPKRHVAEETLEEIVEKSVIVEEEEIKGEECVCIPEAICTEPEEVAATEELKKAPDVEVPKPIKEVTEEIVSKSSSCGVFCWATSGHGEIKSSSSVCSSVFCWSGHPHPPIKFEIGREETPQSDLKPEVQAPETPVEMMSHTEESLAEADKVPSPGDVEQPEAEIPEVSTEKSLSEQAVIETEIETEIKDEIQTMVEKIAAATIPYEASPEEVATGTVTEEGEESQGESRLTGDTLEQLQKEKETLQVQDPNTEAREESIDLEQQNKKSAAKIETEIIDDQKLTSEDLLAPSVTNTSLPTVTPAKSTSSATLQSFLADLQEKCQKKDKMISALANELQLRACSRVWENLLNDIANVDSPVEPPCDFDQEKLCKYLRRPSDLTMLSAPITSKLETESTPTLFLEVKPRFKQKETEKSQAQNKEDMLQEPGTIRNAHSASNVANTTPHGLHVIRHMEPDSLLLGWNAPPHSSLSGFEIYVNGVFVHKVHSPLRNKALIRNVDLSSKMIITLYAVTPNGRSSEPAYTVFPEKNKLMLENK